MVSEGVDIPRLAVGVYATSVSTPLFFAQAVGRFVRARRRGETASVFVPSIPLLLGYAAELEAERDHVLRRREDDPEGELAEAERRRDTADGLGDTPFMALGGSAHFDRVLYDGGEFGTSAEEEDFLGLPGLLDPEQVTLLLRKRRADQARQRSLPATAHAAALAGAGVTPALARPSSSARQETPEQPATRETLAALRKELNGLVRAWHHRSGQPHGAIHAELRRTCGGPPLPEATGAQIRARIETIRRWATSGR
jgi:superfamily II DNA or RNA helicase